MRQGIMWALFLYLGAATCASARTASTIPPIEAIIAGMAQARAENQAHFRSYIVTRDYKLFGKERAKTESQVIADISFVPPATKKYTIQKASGTGFGETIVRRMLMSEVEIAKDFASTDFSPDNYDFRFILEENVVGQRCYVLELLPKRKDKNLLRGKIWVDADTYLPRHIEGEPVKTPSWWLRSLRIELNYGEVGGMWLQTALEATAAVRILGPHTMVSRDVRYQMNDLVVAARSKRGVEQMQDGFYRRGVMKSVEAICSRALGTSLWCSKRDVGNEPAGILYCVAAGQDVSPCPPTEPSDLGACGKWNNCFVKDPEIKSDLIVQDHVEESTMDRQRPRFLSMMAASSSSPRPEVSRDFQGNRNLPQFTGMSDREHMCEQ